MTKAQHTPGPWKACNMVHEEGRPMTPEELGEYVCNSVKHSPETRFLFISGDNGDGDVDVCHIGNGPRGPANARLIAAAPELLEICENWVELVERTRKTQSLFMKLEANSAMDFMQGLKETRAAIAKAKGET